jgi:ABC-type uncharacterized transport system permease subunit
MYKPQYSNWALPGIRAVKREHRQWRIEKGVWFVILGMFVIGTALLFIGLKASM